MNFTVIFSNGKISNYTEKNYRDLLDALACHPLRFDIMNTTKFPSSHGYYTKEQVADFYNVALRTVQQWIDKGWIESVYFGGAHHIEAGQLDNFTRPKPGRRTEKK